MPSWSRLPLPAEMLLSSNSFNPLANLFSGLLATLTFQVFQRKSGNLIRTREPQLTSNKKLSWWELRQLFDMSGAGNGRGLQLF